jgi:glycosyltransferase involved in cell wall biosynthesis
MVKVSVLMLAYNHEKYIEQAVRGVMMQEGDFECELVIGEDCSTDSTRKIVEQLRDEFPDKIVLLLHPRNIGMIPNMMAVYEACQGKYIAICEGDDYWADPHKLQKQIDYLESNPDCRLCFHAAKIVYVDEPHRSDGLKAPRPGIPIDLSSWMKHKYLATASVLFRKPPTALPSWFSQLEYSGDYPLFVWLLSVVGGTMHYMAEPEPMCVYRRHAGGVTHGDSPDNPVHLKRLHGHLRDILRVRKNLSFWDRKHLRIRVFRVYLDLARAYHARGELWKARRQLLLATRYFPISRGELSKFFAASLLCSVPGLYERVRGSKQPRRIFIEL